MKNQLTNKYKLKCFSRKIDSVVKILERLEEGNLLLKSISENKTTTSTTIAFNTIESNFPIDNDDDLKLLEEQIQIDMAYRKKLVNIYKFFH